MSLGLWRKINLFLAFLLVVALILLAAPAWSSGDDITQSNDMNNQTGGDIDIATDLVGGDLNGGDLIGGENKSLALVAPGMGDVDIAQCLGSTQWSLLIGAKQKLVLNHVCMAEFYLKQGKYRLAAQSLCNQKEILAEYETESACEVDHNFGPVEPTGMTFTVEEYDELMAQAVQQEEYEEQVMLVEERFAQQVNLINALEKDHDDDEAEILRLKREAAELRAAEQERESREMVQQSALAAIYDKRVAQEEEPPTQHEEPPHE